MVRAGITERAVLEVSSQASTHVVHDCGSTHAAAADGVGGLGAGLAKLGQAGEALGLVG